MTFSAGGISNVNMSCHIEPWPEARTTPPMSALPATLLASLPGRRPPRRSAGHGMPWGSVRSRLHAGEEHPEELVELGALVVAEPGEELGLEPDADLARRLPHRPPGRRDAHEDPAPVVRVHLTGDVTGLLEAVEAAGHPGPGDLALLCDEGRRGPEGGQLERDNRLDRLHVSRGHTPLGPRRRLLLLEQPEEPLHAGDDPFDLGVELRQRRQPALDVPVDRVGDGAS